MGRTSGIIAVAVLATACGAPAASKVSPPPAPEAVTPAGAPPPRARVRLGTLWNLRPIDAGGGVGLAHGGGGVSERDHALGGLSGGIAIRGGGGMGLRVSPRTVPRPTVRAGAPSTSGGIDRAIIQRVVRRYLPRMRYCYERRLRVVPGLQGVVRARFTISSTGTVTSAHASGMDSNVAACVRQVVRVMRFPRPNTGTVNVTYPFVFRPRGGSSSGVVPLDTPPPPPPPVPVVRTDKPKPIAETESPVRKLTEAAPAAPTGAPACFVADQPDGLDSLIPAATGCYQRALEDDPTVGGRLALLLSIDSAGQVAGVDYRGAVSKALGDCVAGAARSLVLSGSAADQLRGNRAVLTLALDRDGGPDLPSQPVTVTPHDLRLGLRLVASEVPWGKVDALHRDVWKRVAAETGHRDEPLVLRLDDSVDTGAVVTAMSVLGKRADSIRFARRVDGDWRVVNRLANPRNHGLCPGVQRSRVSVRIDTDAIWLGTDAGYIKISKQRGAHDLLGFARELRALRRRELVDRSDLELAVTIGVSYQVFATALEIAIETGFHDAAVKPLHLIRNPRQLRARQ